MTKSMLGFSAKVFAAVLCVIALVWLALWYFIPAPPTTIRIMAGFNGGNFEHIAIAYRERLARQHVKLDIGTNNQGVIPALKLIQDRTSGVDATFTFAGVSNATELPSVVSLGRIGFNPVSIFYRGEETLERLTQLKGKRIGANLDFPPLVRILNASGVNAENSTLLNRVGPGAADALQKGDLDVVLNIAAFSALPTQRLLRDPTIRMMNLTQAEALTRVFPYLSRLVLPQGAIDLEKNIPPIDVNLIATTSSVLVRRDLHPQLIYLLAQTLQEEHGGAGVFHRAGEFPTQTDPEYPMAEEAVDYYKNGPSFLQRYLPFWMINYAKRMAAILVAAIAVVIPLFTFTPKLYAWLLHLRLARLYRRLRAVNARLKGELTTEEVSALQGDLDHIDRAANILPMRHSDLFFALLMHIDMTRTRLAARSAALQRLNPAA